MKVLIIIPAHNEEECLAQVVRGLRSHCPDFDYIVVDDGSTDNTLEECRKNGLAHLRLPINLGLTAAVQTGMRYAYENGYDMAVQFDADGQHRPEYLEAMVEKIQEGSDIVIGSRYLVEKKPFNLRMFGSFLISWMIRLTTRVPITDPTSGMRMYSRRVIREFALSLNYGPEPDTISYLIKKGARCTEIPVLMDERLAGESYFTFAKSVGYMLHMSISILLIQWARKRPKGKGGRNPL